MGRTREEIDPAIYAEFFSFLLHFHQFKGFIEDSFSGLPLIDNLNQPLG